MTTTVVNIRHSECDIYIGRPSIWGNPYEEGKDGTRAEVVMKYKTYLHNNPKLLAQLHTLKGKRLGCWCEPKLCHGHVIVELLNEVHPQTCLVDF